MGSKHALLSFSHTWWSHQDGEDYKGEGNAKETAAESSSQPAPGGAGRVRTDHRLHCRRHHRRCDLSDHLIEAGGDVRDGVPSKTF